MIFPRSRLRGNATPGWWPLAGLAVLTAGLALAGCASPSRVHATHPRPAPTARLLPANVVLPEAHNSGYALAFDGRSRTLASGGTEGRIRLWALPDGRELAGWTAHDGSLQGLQFLDRDREILSAAWDGTLARWTRDGRLRRRAVTPAPITDMVADEATALIVTGHYDGHVRLWRLSDFSLLQDLALHRGAVRAVAYHPRTRQLASSGTDGRVLHWRRNGAARELPAPPTDARSLAFAPDGKILMGSGWFKLFRWRPDNASLTVLPTAHQGLVNSISFDRDGRSLASIGRLTDSAVYRLDARTGAVLQRFQPHDLCGTVVRLSPDGRYLASTSDDANVHIWDLRNLLPERNYFSEK